MPTRIGIPDLISPSYFPLIAAVELGFCAREDVEATIELVFPVTTTYERLRDGELQFVGGSAHAALSVFPRWDGCRILCALSQGTYWFLVVRADIEGSQGDLSPIRGLRVGAAPGPVDALRRMLEQEGIDPDTDVDIAPVPGAAAAGNSFGVTAARALEQGDIDAFWANGMAAEVAMRSGAGRVLVDSRRPPHPAGVDRYTISALLTTSERADGPEAAAVTRAVVAAQAALRDDPDLAVDAAARFPADERTMIADLVRRDAPFYDASLPPDRIEAMNEFARAIGLLDEEPVPYEHVVATASRIGGRP